MDLLAYLRTLPSAHLVQRLGLTLAATQHGRPARYLAPKTINRILAAVSSFYDYMITAGQFTTRIRWRKSPSRSRHAARSGTGPFSRGSSGSGLCGGASRCVPLTACPACWKRTR